MNRRSPTFRRYFFVFRSHAFASKEKQPLQRAAAVGCRAKMGAEIESGVTRFEAIGLCDGLLLANDPRNVIFVKAAHEIGILKVTLCLTYQVIDLVRGHARNGVLDSCPTPRETMEIFRSPLRASTPPFPSMLISTAGAGTETIALKSSLSFEIPYGLRPFSYFHIEAPCRGDLDLEGMFLRRFGARWHEAKWNLRGLRQYVRVHFARTVPFGGGLARGLFLVIPIIVGVILLFVCAGIDLRVMRQ